MPRLVGQSHEFAGKSFELMESVVSVGRTAGNGVHIPDNSVSSHHAELRLDGMDYAVKDLDSTNGTRINGEKITTGNLRRNDTVRFGNVEFLYESENDPVLAPLPEVTSGLDLVGCASRGRPPHFTSGGAVDKAKKKDGPPWNLFIIIASIVAVAGLGYFLFLLFTTPAP